MSNAKMRKIRAEVSAELLRIHTTKGGLRPSEVVAEARSKDSPLHGEFEWDDKKAGAEHRLNQARQLIRVAVITRTQEDGTTKIEPFIHVPATHVERVGSGSKEGTYYPLNEVVKDVDKFALALSELQSKLRSAEHSAKQLRDAAEESGGGESDRLSAIAIAITSLGIASSAVMSLH